MRAVDGCPLTRRAHSATKVKEFEQVLSSCDFKEYARVSCASASCYSTRKIGSEKQFKNVFPDASADQGKSADNKRKKLFLYASQVLGKLKNFSRENRDSPVSFSEKASDSGVDLRSLKLNLRKVNFYYSLLKRLLEERCVLLLNEESHTCVKETQRLVTDLKFLYSNEMIKLTTMPIKIYNRFIDSSGISIAVLEQVFKKVNYICDLHSSLKNNYQNILNFFHVGFDMDLNQMLLKVNKFQNKLYSEMFYWTHKILEMFILKLCLADPDTISPEFLHHVVEICESFNLLFLDKKQVKYAYLTNTYNVLFNCFMQSDYEAILLDFILQYLSHFEAKVAAEKIIQFLIHECKNLGYAALKEKSSGRDKKDFKIVDSNTSDYHSSSPTVIEIDNATEARMSVNSAFNFENVFSSFIQRNQSLVLKYLYSIICLDASVINKGNLDSSENYRDSSVTRAWNLPQNSSKNRSYLFLEERYWIRFWEKVLTFSLKLILEVPCHQYGNAAVGVFLLWPPSHHLVVVKCLKSVAESKDIPVSGLDVVKEVLNTLLIQTVHESWDKNMLHVLSLTHGQPCMPIPVATNKVRTRIGNALCSCLEDLRHNFSSDSFIREFLHLQTFYPFQVTLDCFTSLYNTKARACLSSYDISTYLLISCSDCVYACELLEEKELSVFLNDRHHILFSSGNKKSSVSKQIEILSGHASEAPNVVHRLISDTVRKTSVDKLRKRCIAIRKFSNSELCLHRSLDEVLNSFTDIINYIHDKTSILSAITSAVACELLSVLRRLHKRLSLQKVQAVKGILSDFLKWLEQVNIEQSERDTLIEMKCLKKLSFIIQLLESETVKQKNHWSYNNKIAPLNEDANIEEHLILTEEEALQWHLSAQSHFIPCF